MTLILTAPQVSQALLTDLDRVGRRYGRWSAPAYFELDGPYLVEYCRGRLEILPMPTMAHQRVASRLYEALRAAAPRDGWVLFAGARVQVGPDAFREPDVLYIPAEWTSFIHKEYTERAALVIEVLSDSNRDHDLSTKRDEYAAAGIAEYWIVDPRDHVVTVLRLESDRYVVSGEFAAGACAASSWLDGFRVDVQTLFADLPV